MKNIKVIIYIIILVISIVGCAHNRNIQNSPDKSLDTLKKELAGSANTGGNTAAYVDQIDNSKKSNDQHPDIIDTIKPDTINISKQGNSVKACSSQLPDDIMPIPADSGRGDDDIENFKSPSAKLNGRKNNSEAIMDEALDYCQMSQELWQNGELENAIEALDQAYSLILSVNIDENNANLAQQKEDIRYTISKRILEIYASRNFAVNGNHKAIPMLVNSHVQAEIDLFSTGVESNFFRESLKRSGRFRAKIIEELKKAGMPVELSWLPLIESGFKVTALSPARALGLWQFIPSTGYKFGLKRDLFVDERLDPIKSTLAAIDYLKELHQMFGDWTTVLAAYNCGEGRVLGVIRDQNVNYLDNFWDLYEKLPRETSRYVPRFLATLQILSNPGKYGIDTADLECPVEYEIIDITKQVHIKDIAKEINVDEMLLRRLNPELRYGILPPYEYLLKVPPGKGKELLAKIDTIPISSLTQTKPQISTAYYKVKRGDSLLAVAKRYNISIKRLMHDNKMRKPVLLAGTMLRVPYKEKSALSAPETAKTIQQSSRSEAAQPLTHVVKSGESLLIIANRHKTTVNNIKELNKLNTMYLRVGQVLYLNKPGNDEDDNIFKKYRVKRGENLFRISQKHNMPLDRLLSINKLRPKSKIHTGQYIYVE